MLNIKQLEQAQKDFIDALRTAEKTQKTKMILTPWNILLAQY